MNFLFIYIAFARDIEMIIQPFNLIYAEIYEKLCDSKKNIDAISNGIHNDMFIKITNISFSSYV